MAEHAHTTPTTNPPSVTMVTRQQTFIPGVHVYDALPFVNPPQNDGVRNFLAPRSTGRYAYDTDLGALYGIAALPYLRDRHHGPQLMRMIVLAMADRADAERDRGLIVGMFGVLGEAIAGLPVGRV